MMRTTTTEKDQRTTTYVVFMAWVGLAVSKGSHGFNLLRRFVTMNTHNAFVSFFFYNTAFKPSESKTQTLDENN